MTPFPLSAAPDAAESTLAALEPGASASVIAVDVPGEVGERLMEMGMTRGTRVTVVRRGFLGDPLQVNLRGYMLTLRKAQARLIRVRR
ncbi:MAG: ferrous iron transport protein A [Myxococcota bacterium]